MIRAGPHPYGRYDGARQMTDYAFQLAIIVLAP